MIPPRSRAARLVAFGVPWAILFVAAAPAGLTAQPRLRVAALPRAQFQPPPAQPPPATPPPATPSQPPSTPAPPPGQPAPPGLMPPGPFVPQPGVPPQTLPPQKVVEVVVRGNEHVPTDQILAVVSTKPNDPLNDDKLRNDVQAILNLGEFADVVVRFEPLPDGVRVAFVVVENPIVASIDITGNTIIPTPVVLKALGVETDKVLNTVTMRNGLRAIEKLYQDKGYILARVADVSVSPEGVLRVALTEGRIETIKVDGLVKTHEYVVLRAIDFGGNGQSVRIEYSSTALFGTGLAISFHEPYFEGSRTVLDTQLFNTTTIPTDYTLGLNSSFQYDLTQVGGYVSFTSPLGPGTSVNYGFKAVTTTFGPPLIGTPPPGNFPFTPGQVNALILGAALDTRDDPLNPTAGDHLQLIGEFAFRVLGGAFSFQKYELDYAHFIPVTAADTLVGRVHLGYSATPLPIQEQLYLGGQAALRGYVTSRFRGDEMAFAQAEYRFPISELPLLHSFGGITGVVFVEAGDAEPTGSQLILKGDVGIGIQVKTAVGPFRLDYGVSPEGSQVWISTGAQF